MRPWVGGTLLGVTGPGATGTEDPGRSFEHLREWISSEPAFAEVARFDEFYAGLSPLESRRVGRLWSAVCACDDDDGRGADAEVIVRAMPDEDGEGALPIRTFAEAILGRVNGAGSGGNLYLGARPPGAQLRAFELLRLRTPLIPFAYAAANRAILGAIGDVAQPVTLIDVGIGRGGQIRALLRNPQARRQISKLHVIGVEPDSSSSTGAGALEMAEAAVLEAANEVGIEASFRPVSKRAEELTAADFSDASGLVIGNAAFALHHVDYEGAGGLVRGDVLGLLASIGVDSMVMVEPDSNHASDSLAVRFAYAYRHYRTVSMSLRAMLTPADAQLAWTEFFAPEVHNVITHEGSRRTERHETATRWAEHLRGAGFSIRDLKQLVPTSGTPPGFGLHCDPEAFSLCFNGVGILSVLCGSQR